MIGDLYLFVKLFIHQQLLCIHDYKEREMWTIDHKSYEVCTKCDKIK